MQAPDPLDRLRDATVNAVATYIDWEASGLMSVLRRSVDYAIIDTGRKQIVVDRRAILLAMIAIGVDPSYQFANCANWFAAWLGRQLPSLDLAKISTDVKTAQKRLTEDARGGYPLVVSESLQGVFEDAVGITRSTRNRDKVALRHLFVALIRQRSHSLEIKELRWKPRALEVRDLRTTLFEEIGRRPEPGESIEAWRNILGQAGSDSPTQDDSDRATNESGPVGDTGSGTPSGRTAAPPTPALPPYFVSSFSADRTTDHESDPLETEADVLAMARLICHEDADPPISIGVFGGWGSGKSTFMEALQWEVARLTATEPKGGQPEEGPRFVSPVVQIRFNAWQFADADLWASLTAEFFDQLRAGGFEGGGKRIHAELVEEVNEHVRGLSHEAARQRAELAKADEKVREAQSAHAKAVKRQETDVEQALVSGLAEALEHNRADLTRYGIIDNRSADGLSEFISLARDARTEWGRVKRIPGMLFGQWPLLAGVVLLGAVIATGAYIIFANKAAAAAVAWLLTVAIGLLPVIRRGLALIDTVVKQIGPFAEKLNKADEKGLRRVLATEVALRSAAGEAEALRASSERAERSLARYVDPTAKANPPRVLRYLLEDDPDTRAFEKEIGLIGRARRLFQALDEIVAENRSKRDRLRALRLQANAKEDGAHALERDRLAEEVDDQIPDRIILYIDDLDRCTHEQVYKVLQAVHLLLAFRLFVVVVGVDMEWVEAAVARSIEFAGKESEKPEVKDKARRERAIEYMSKIFQLPFWLKPFGGEEDTRYSDYVRSLTRTAAPPVSAPPADERRPDDWPKGDAGAHEAPGPAPPPLSAAEPGSAQQGQEAPDPAAGSESASDSVARALRTLQLDKVEEDFLASPEISALAATDPRGVKRLVNVYKIVRARMSETDDAMILGDNFRPPAYPLIAICAAVETGQSLEVADNFYDNVRSIPDIPSVAPSIATAIAAAITLRGGRATNAQDFLPVARVVRRYSFNRYH